MTNFSPKTHKNDKLVTIPSLINMYLTYSTNIKTELCCTQKVQSI